MTKVVNILNYADTLTNITLIDGLSPDIIKRRYIWLFNAIIEDAILGQDDYGLVWYTGIWYAGEWEDGTWYNGIWHDGEWKNGRWYSYRFDIAQLLQRNVRILEKDNPIYSQFRRGVWRKGDFHNGYFGSPDFKVWNTAKVIDVPNTELTKKPALVDIINYHTRWESGNFYNGIFRNSGWLSGSFFDGLFYNSQWINGVFSKGTFQGNCWWDGNFSGGDFIYGLWLKGKVNQTNPSVLSRIGSMPVTGTTDTGTTVIWYEGDFLNGEFHSGLNIISGKTYKSNNHNRTWWFSGTWFNGSWYGGTHVSGEYDNGYWFEGFWSGGTFNNGYWENGFWLDGTINNGVFVQGLMKYATVNGGKLGYQPVPALKENIDLKLSKPTEAPKSMD